VSDIGSAPITECLPVGATAAPIETIVMLSIVTYAAAALAEIAGCFAFWAWLRMDRSPLWLVPGVL
jgi:hypothetical protein